MANGLDHTLAPVPPRHPLQEGQKVKKSLHALADICLATRGWGQEGQEVKKFGGA